MADDTPTTESAQIEPVEPPQPLEAMTREEGAALIECERKIDQAVRSAGRIAGDELRRIRDQRLYRARHASFQSYVVERWGFSRATADRMIDVAKARDERAVANRSVARETAGQRNSRASEPEISQREAARRMKASRRGEAPGPVPSEADRIAEQSQREAAKQRPVADSPRTVDDPIDLVPEDHLVRDLIDVRRPDRAEPDVVPGPVVEQAKSAAPTGRVEAEWEETVDRVFGSDSRAERLMGLLDDLPPAEAAQQLTTAQVTRLAEYAAAVRAASRPARSTASRPEQLPAPGVCKHPPGRRIGDACMDCGAVLKRKSEKQQ